MDNRKKYISLDQKLFEQIKRLLQNESVKKICEITGMGKSQIYKIKEFIEQNPNSDAYSDFVGKKGRKIKDVSNIESKIREIYGRDNALTQIGVKTVLANEQIHTSSSTLCRLVKSAGLTRKRLKRKACVILNDSHKRVVADYASKILGMRGRTIVFLDECGFNLHVSNNYGYSAVNQDAIAIVRPSRGPNISLCAIFSMQGIIGSKIIGNAFDRIQFKQFLEEMIHQEKISTGMVLVMDNVRFHHVVEIKDLMRGHSIECLYLPSYSPQLNPIENVFSVLKSKVSSYRPIANNKEILLEYISRSIEDFNSNDFQFFLNFYRKMWDNINNALNSQ